MIAADLPPLWLPSKPAIIQSAESALLKPREAMFFVPPALWISGPPKSFTLIGPNSGTTSTISISGAGSIQAGDFCLLGNAAVGTTTPITLSGFTSLQSVTVGSRGIVQVAGKVLTGAETMITGLSSSVQAWALVVYRPAGGKIKSFALNSNNGQGTTGDPMAQTITAGSGAPPLITFGTMYSNDGSSDWRDVTGAGGGGSPSISPSMTQIDAATGFLLHHLLYNSSPANISYDMADHGQNIMTSGYITFA
jgi:hypothetical protein